MEADHGWGFLAADGTVTLKDVGNPPSDVQLERARIGDIKKYGLMVEDADRVTRTAEAKIRSDIGMDEPSLALVNALHNATELTPEALAQAPDVTKMEAEYMEGIQRFLLGDDNPYPAIFMEMLKDMGGVDLKIDQLSSYMLAQSPLAAIISHWQNAPLVPGTQPPQTTPRPNRASRRSGTATTR